MNRLIILFISTLTLFFTTISYAQNTKLIVSPDENQIILRWGFPDKCSVKNVESVIYKKTKNSHWQKIAAIRPDINRLKLILKNYPDILNFLLKEKSQISEDDELLLILFYMKSIYDIELAKAAGIYYADKNINKDDFYYYKIETFCKNKKANKMVSEKPVSLKQYKKPPKIDLTLQQIEKYVGLKWNKNDVYKLYFIYRNGKNLTPNGFYLSPEKTSKQFFYQDLDNLQIGKTYTYQIEGVTLAGKRVKSNTVKIEIKDLIAPPAPENLRYEIINNKILKLSWNPVKVKDLEYYNVYCAKTLVGSFKKVNKSPVTKTYFEQTKPRENCYYVVTSVDKAGNESKHSSPVLVTVVDNTPPHKVKNLKAKVENNKIVLYWKRPKDDDLMGYKIYRRMGDKGKFILLTLKPIKQEKFTDETLKKDLDFVYIYYQVRAVDTSNNHSKPVTVKTKLPDITPPPFPIISKYDIDKKGKVKLYIQTATKDVDKLKLLITKKDFSREEIIKVKSPDIEYELKKLPAGKLTLKITALDKAGNESKPFFANITVPETEKNKKKAKIKLKKEKETCTVSFKLPENYFIYIYRNNIRVSPAIKNKGEFKLKCSSKKEIAVKLFDDKAEMIKKFSF